MLGLLLAGLAAATFNNTKCPSPQELQASAAGLGNFELEDLAGTYYELAFHDYTQYPLCPQKQARCITSEKRVERHSDGVVFVNDTWNLECMGHFYPQHLLFNATGTPGFLMGYVPDTRIPFLPKGVVAGMKFPDTVVDFRSGPRGWALEMQCVEHFGRVVFIGINFYAKSTDESVYQEMLAAAERSGIGFYMHQGFGLRRVDQTDCGRPAAALIA
jgi:hypothetical protein